MTTPTIGINPFVTRQTRDSRFSHYAGSFEDVIELAKANFENATDGYRDGVCLVSVAPEAFFSGVVQITEETQLRATFEARRKGEDPFLNVVAIESDKLPAKVVELVLYRRDVLLEDSDDSAPTGCEWELISINARPTEEPEPMHPVAMARNMLGMSGGSAASYTAEEFAKAVVYWSNRAMCG